MRQIFETEIGGKPFSIATGEVAKQAQGSAVVNYGDTTVLIAVAAKNEDPNKDFFPLMVVYQEKMYAAGKIPGGFLRREGRSSERETLAARLIDRPIRPLFPDGFNYDVQIVATVLSSDPEIENNNEITALIGSSIALMLSPLPFKGPIAAVNVGRINGKLVINPTSEEAQKSDLELTVAGTKDAINMVESCAQEISEKDMLEALMFAHKEIGKICSWQEKIISKLKPEKIDFKEPELDKKLVKDIEKYATSNIKKALVIFDKQERDTAISNLKEKTINHFLEKNNADKLNEEDKINFESTLNQILENIIKTEFRLLITKDKIRPDGRKSDEIRPLSSRIDVLKRTHGSSLFTRGQTQSLGVLTLGSLRDSQIIDDITQEESKRFLFHYNFPPFSVGETGRYGGAGRREIGHGNLARKALLPVIPSEEEFPYTIRLVSEILESNGSSSMASVCSGCLALMAGGVPIKKPVAGIAMGLIKENRNYTILSDIQGMEDALGDMDFKVTGTKDGITALQMDIKIEGITKKILQEALKEAKKGRLFILKHLSKTINKPRLEVSKHAPRVKMIKVKPEFIKDIIGAGGKVINEIIERNNDVKIDIEQDGTITVMHMETKYINQTIEEIKNIVRVPEVGKIYEAIVKRIEKYGCFVELWPGTEGLVHISQLDFKHVKQVEDVCKIGDQILVKVIGIDKQGRIDLSRKDALKKK